MKILMLTTNSSLLDGINRHILNISIALNEQPDIDVAVCIVHPEGEFQKKLQDRGIAYFTLGFSNGHNLGIFRAFEEIVDQFCPDIIHLHVLALMERVYLSVHKGKYKLIQTIHGISDDKNQSFRDCIERCILKAFPLHIDGRCYISEGVRKYYERLMPPVKISQVCYNPMKFSNGFAENSHKLHKILKIREDDYIIGTACRIAAVKNPIAFTTVMCNVLTSILNAHAVVIGAGDDTLEQECKSIIKNRCLENRFHWLGYRVDAQELVQDLDCFIMTSVTEGMPTAVLECFASKTPVAILEGEGGINDIIQLNSCNPIVISAPRKDLRILSDRIVHMLMNRQEAVFMTENAYRVGKNVFGMESVINDLKNVYLKTLESR